MLFPVNFADAPRAGAPRKLDPGDESLLGGGRMFGSAPLRARRATLGAVLDLAPDRAGDGASPATFVRGPARGLRLRSDPTATVLGMRSVKIPEIDAYGLVKCARFPMACADQRRL
jgi:hypothetical protein